ncbi:hypothetical protein EVA_19362 [gut metagenome]|uniref:Uncharacterized protein n=1 Tax=gut metagenome TaxID=749906 RepID=J9FCE6_9ZZZZ
MLLRRLCRNHKLIKDLSLLIPHDTHDIVERVWCFGESSLQQTQDNCADKYHQEMPSEGIN